MTREYVGRMGVSASNIPPDSAGNVPMNMGMVESISPSGCRPPVEQMGVIVRDRKKKTTGFATLRKKFIRRRRSSKACDHGRMLRELVSDWSTLEVAALLEEYEALAALKDLSVQAELARPPAATFKQDLSALYDFKYCTDADLVYRGACFPIHRALLSARCPYFRDLLSGCPGYGARICLELRTSAVDVQMFSALLRYLYTGDICTHDANIDLNLLCRLREEFGTPNPLETDLRYLLETGDYADAALVFTSDGGDCHRPDSSSSEYGFRPKVELPCHKAILSARSPFFRNLIQRRTRTGEEHTERALHIPTRIVLDECVIPKRYARVLLHAVYLDTVDLSLILRGTGCGTSLGSLGEVQQLTQGGRVRPSPLEEAMELYQIGRFLELDILAQGCEDLILEWLTLDSLATVLHWACQPHGSAWVHRQALHFLREEFQPVSQSPVLHQLDKTHLIEVLQSNFLQASELEVLTAVLKWGEHELVRRMEDREPNLLNHTAHSVSRKGVKKRDLSDVELREILSDLLPLVRMDHVLPPNNDVLNQAIRRGLVSTPPSHMIGDERENLRVNAWIRGGKNGGNGLFVRPRLFMPYYEEVKVLLEDQLVQEVEMLRLRRARYMQDIPDTLYMVEEKPRAHGTAGVDVLAAVLPVPDAATMSAMLKREQKLRQSPACQRAIALQLSSRHEINRQIRLRVVREFNLPDPVADMLENSTCYCLEEPVTDGADEPVSLRSTEDDPVVHPSPSKASSASSGLPMCYGRNFTFPRGGGSVVSGTSTGTATTSSQVAIGQSAGAGNITGATAVSVYTAAHSHSHSHSHTTHSQRYELPAIIPEGDSFRFSVEPESSSCSDGHLSDIMPDVAMATASIGQLQLHEQEMELDLGDGARGHGGHGAHGNHSGHGSHSGHGRHGHHVLSNQPVLPQPIHLQPLPHGGYHRYLAGPGPGPPGPPVPTSYSVHRHSDSSSYHSGTPRFL